MKRIAVFCDGTWNRADARHPTNVFKLHRAIRKTGLDGTAQLPKYIPGVGTGYNLSGFAKLWDMIRGGAFGVGVTKNILTAYQFIGEQYEPGDQIYVLGFSRGAFTARSLVGLIRASGLPAHGRADRALEALRWYRDRARFTAPGTESSHRFRLDYSPDVATSQAEIDWRVARGHPAPPLLNISYLGVWDTVGSLGVPSRFKLLAGLLNGGHKFHDTSLSSSVMAARHAVAIDETRTFFPPTLWRNLERLNGAEPAPRDPQYCQCWFPGDHAAVGGSGDIVGLSNIALRWVAEGAALKGLDFDWNELHKLRAEEDVTVQLNGKSARPGFLAQLLSYGKLDRPREFGPIDPADLSEAAKARHQAMPDYRPNLF